MLHVRQENLPFVGSSHEFVGAEQGDTGVSLFLFHGKPGSGPGPHRHPFMTRFGSCVKGGECGRSTARPSGRAERATLDKPPKRMETRFKTTAGDVTLPPGQTQGTVDRIDGIDVRFRVEPVPMRGNLIRERPSGRHAGWPA